MRTGPLKCSLTTEIVIDSKADVFMNKFFYQFALLVSLIISALGMAHAANDCEAERKTIAANIASFDDLDFNSFSKAKDTEGLLFWDNQAFMSQIGLAK